MVTGPPHRDGAKGCSEPVVAPSLMVVYLHSLGYFIDNFGGEVNIDIIKHRHYRVLTHLSQTLSSTYSCRQHRIRYISSTHELLGLLAICQVITVTHQ